MIRENNYKNQIQKIMDNASVYKNCASDFTSKKMNVLQDATDFAENYETSINFSDRE